MSVRGARPRSIRAGQCLLGVSAFVVFWVACGGSDYTTPVATTPPAPVETGMQEGPEHGFDPRAFYGRKALSTQRGAASFYADRFRGRLTANGERYDPNAYTAAHRSLPFGTVVRVVHESSGDWVLVRVNDRGPYGPGRRIVDLSRQAAQRLSMINDGVVRVRLEVLQLGDGKYRSKASRRARP